SKTQSRALPAAARRGCRKTTRTRPADATAGRHPRAKTHGRFGASGPGARPPDDRGAGPDSDPAQEPHAGGKVERFPVGEAGGRYLLAGSRQSRDTRPFDSAWFADWRTETGPRLGHRSQPARGPAAERTGLLGKSRARPDAVARVTT